MVKISEIVDQNPWWKHNTEFIRYDKHLKDISPVFFERKEIALEKGGIYILRGPRQIGKTTYLKNSIRKLIGQGIPPKSILYLSLDFFTSRREMRNAIKYFIDSTKDFAHIYLFLDEITSLEDWNLELKYMADQGITKRAVILATGSSAVKLKEKGELLPGRGLEGNEYYIKPMSFREFAIQSIDFITTALTPSNELYEALKNLKPVLKDSTIDLSCNLEDIRKEIQKISPFKRELGYLFQIYLITGGFPRVINHYFSNYYQLKRDGEMIQPQISEIFIRDVLGDIHKLGKQESIAREIIKTTIEKYTSRYSFSKLSSDINHTHVTIIDYLEFLENSFISFILHAYDFNKKQPKLKGDKKVYFFDPFIFYSFKSFLTGKLVWDIIVEIMQEEEVLGKIVEGMVVAHFLMSQEIPFLKNTQTFLWNYYDKRGKEIDIVLKDNEEYSAIEVKYKNEVSEKQISTIEQIKKYILLSKEDIGNYDRITIIPVDIFLSLLHISERNI